MPASERSGVHQMLMCFVEWNVEGTEIAFFFLLHHIKEPSRQTSSRLWSMYMLHPGEHICLNADKRKIHTL